jgi:hypothetical protein
MDKGWTPRPSKGFQSGKGNHPGLTARVKRIPGFHQGARQTGLSFNVLLWPELALAFTCVTAVSASMIRRFRIEDAKSCIRVCRRILLYAATPPPSDAAQNACSLTSIDAIIAAITLLTCHLCPLDDIDSTYLIIEETGWKWRGPEEPDRRIGHKVAALA